MISLIAMEGPERSQRVTEVPPPAVDESVMLPDERDLPGAVTPGSGASGDALHEGSVGRSAEADPSPKTARGCAAATALAAEAAAGQLATAACESPLPEEEQARAVAALAARQSTTTATAAADAAAEGGGPAGASAACASVEADAPAAGQLCLGALAEAAASGAAPALAGKVPACVLSRLPAEGGAGSQEATPGPALTAAAPRPSSRSRVRQLAPMQDDGRLPAYSLGLAEEQQPGDKRGRRGDHADEDPALKPVDLFIGGLPPHADEMGVFDAVVSAGEVVGVKLIRRKRDRGDCRGYGFVRVANQEAAQAVCQGVKEACGVPVALSTLGRQSLEDLHAAARQQCAAHPLAVPEEDCSLRRLLKAVERQPDPAAAVTTALVAVLRVPSRPRLAFPGGRPKPQTAEAASEPRLAEQTGWPAGEQQQQNGRVEEKQPDCTLPGSSYLERFPEVAALMEQFRARGQEAKTPLAVVNEYAARLALRVELGEAPAAGAGVFTAAAKLLDVGGRQLANSTGSGRSKQIAKQVAGAALLTTILETTSAEDLLAPGKGKQQWQQAQQQRPAMGPEGGHGRGGRAGPAGRTGGKPAPELGSRVGWGRGGGHFGERPHFVAAPPEDAWVYGHGMSAEPGASQSRRPLPRQRAQVAGGFGSTQFGGQPGGMGGAMPGVGGGYVNVVPGTQAQTPGRSQLGGTGSMGTAQLAGLAGTPGAGLQAGPQQSMQVQQAQLQAQQQLLVQQFQVLQQAQAQLQAQAAALAGGAALAGMPVAPGLAGAAGTSLAPNHPAAALGGAGGGTPEVAAGTLQGAYRGAGPSVLAAPSMTGSHAAPSLPHPGNQHSATGPVTAALPAASQSREPAAAGVFAAPGAAASTYSLASQQAAQRASQEAAFASYLAQQQAQQAVQGQTGQAQALHAPAGLAGPPYTMQSAAQQQASVAPASQQRHVQYSQAAQPADHTAGAQTNAVDAAAAAAAAERKYISNTTQQQAPAAQGPPAASAPAAAASALIPVSHYAPAHGVAVYDPAAAAAAAAACYGQHASSAAFDTTNPTAAAASAVAHPGYYGGAYVYPNPTSTMVGAGGTASATMPGGFPWSYSAYSSPPGGGQ